MPPDNPSASGSILRLGLAIQSLRTARRGSSVERERAAQRLLEAVLDNVQVVHAASFGMLNREDLADAVQESLERISLYLVGKDVANDGSAIDSWSPERTGSYARLVIRQCVASCDVRSENRRSRRARSDLTRIFGSLPAMQAVAAQETEGWTDRMLSEFCADKEIRSLIMQDDATSDHALRNLAVRYRNAFPWLSNSALIEAILTCLGMTDPIVLPLPEESRNPLGFGRTHGMDQGVDLEIDLTNSGRQFLRVLGDGRPRSVLIWRFVHEKRLEEIRDRFGIPTSTIHDIYQKRICPLLSTTLTPFLEYDPGPASSNSWPDYLLERFRLILAQIIPGEEQQW